MTNGRNTHPVNVWEALRRLLNCNKQDLAERLDVTRKTLRTWESDTEEGKEPSSNARRAISELLITTLNAAKADQYAQWVKPTEGQGKPTTREAPD